ncbi:MAG: hypothetical protein ACI4L6_02580 [Candidatus Onthoplasma sp.]
MTKIKKSILAFISFGVLLATLVFFFAPVSTSKTEISSAVVNEDASNLTLSWGNSSNESTEVINIFSSIEKNDIKDENNNVIGTWSDSSFDIYGGDKIYLTNENNGSVSICFNGTTNKVTLTPKYGYRVSTITMGSTNSKERFKLTFSYADDYSNIPTDWTVSNTTSTFNGTGTNQYLTPEDLDPNFDGTLCFKATMQELSYKAYLYYYALPDGETAIENEDYIIQTITNTSSVNFPTSVSKTYDDKVFGYWMIVGGVNNYNYTYSNENKKLTVEKGTNKWTFDVDKTLTNLDGNTVYKVTTIQGNADLNDSNLLRAKWSTLYTITFDTGKTANTISDVLINSSTNGDNQIQIQDGYYYNQSAFPCFKNQAFYDELDYYSNNVYKEYSASVETVKGTENYYLSCYGYDISGWYIYIGEENNYKYFIYDKNNTVWTWTATFTDAINDIKNLYTYDKNNTDTGRNSLGDMAGFAESLDISSYSDVITMTPVWTPAKIEVQQPDEKGTTSATTTITYGTIIYGNNYSLSSADAPAGQSIVAYKANNNEQLIPLSGTWNFTSSGMPNGNFKSTTDYSFTYTLEVTQVCVDNIYKISLKDIKPTTIGGNLYQLDSEKTNFTFVENQNYWTTGLKRLMDKDGNFVGFTMPLSSQSNGQFIEDYASVLSDKIDDYKDGLEHQTLDCFKKVFSEYGEFNKTGWTTNNTLNGEYSGTDADPKFYIYLYNGQVIKEDESFKTQLPVFKNDTYLTIFYNQDVDGTINTSGDYQYLTKAYSTDLEEKTFDDDGNQVGSTPIYSNLKNEWKYNTTNSTTLSAYNFRKYLYLNPQTLFDDAIQRVGYIKIDINDTIEETQSTYIAIATEDNSAMNVYNVDAVENIKSDTTLLKIIKFKNGNSVIDFKLYIGCDLTVTYFDQSKDPTNMATGNFDSMIGYRLSNWSMTTLGYTWDSKTYNYSGSGTIPENFTTKILENTIKGKNYNNGDSITITANFEKINYDLTIQLVNKDGETGSNVHSGWFTVKGAVSATGNSANGYTVNLIGLKVDDQIAITYMAYSGFEFNGVNSFVLTYKGENENTITINFVPEEGTQTYTLNLDGKWLRENHYSSHNTGTEDNPIYDGFTGYPTTDATLGTMAIKTKGITFNAVYNFVDTQGKEIKISTIEDYNLASGTQTNSEVKIQFTMGENGVLTFERIPLIEENGMYVFKYENDSYALLKSYFKNDINGNVVKQKEYAFPLETDVESTNLSALNDLGTIFTFETGKILSLEQRTITMTCEIAKIFTITVNVKQISGTDENGVVYGDPNATTRTITLTNTDSNSSTLLVEKGTNLSDGSYGSVTIYTYDGLTTTLNAIYDTMHYQGFKYSINLSTEETSSTDTLTLSSEDNTSVDITFIPKPIHMQILITKDDIELDLENDDVKNINSEILKVINNKANYYFGTVAIDKDVKICEMVNSDYNLEILLNDHELGYKLVENKEGKIVTAQTLAETKVEAVDITKGVLTLHLKLIRKPNADIVVKFGLKSDENLGNEDFGTITWTPTSGVETTGSEVNFNAILGSKVEVKVELNAGYDFAWNNDKVLVSQNYYTPTGYNYDKDSKTLTISENFSENGKGTYIIQLTKIDLKFELDTSSSKLTNPSEYYKLKTQSNDEIKFSTTLKVGQTIKFVATEADDEVIDYFYYEYQDEGSETVRVEIPNGTTLTITNDLIEKMEQQQNGNGRKLTVKIAVIPKYCLNVEYVDNSNALLLGGKAYATVSGVSYEFGTKMVNSTTVSVTADTIVNGKYTISYLIKDLSGNELSSGSGDTMLIDIALDKEKTLSILVQPKQYGITIQDMIYNNLSQLSDGTSETYSEPENVQNNDIESDYASTAVVKIMLTTETAENSGSDLRYVILSGNESQKIRLVFSSSADRKIQNVALQEWSEDESKFVDSTKAISEFGYSININETENMLEITYVVNNNIVVKCEYIKNFTISQI